MSKEKASILIIEDDMDVADMLNAYFNVQDYEVLVSNWGEDGVNTCINTQPHLVILDIRLPDIDGYEVARRLRKNRRTQNIPIIFLTEKRGRTDRLLGLELGADDYITKPFDVQELRLRVRNALRRIEQGALTNPITNLPEGILVDERLEECLDQKNRAILLVGVKNLDKFRDVYGFVASDDVLRAISLMINNAVQDDGAPGDFIGHYSPVEFVVLSNKENAEVLKNRISDRLDQTLDYFYPLKDRGKRNEPKNLLVVKLQTFNAERDIFPNLVDLKNQLSELISA